ncbi:MAG TPA: isoprenylcysteine carboxylmethyltransferase family protein [Burkholderiaceae bacterium]|nr:isoprenylcysteine carboxylmethyltransferase family protein [Burkholderiaceae bacterium]
MRWLELKLPPPIAGLAVAAMMWGATRLVPGAGFELPAHRTIALLFALAGAFIDFAGLVSFRRARTTINPLRPQASSTLVTSGIYRYTRNPMYLGMLAMLIAWGFWLSNALAIATSVLFVAWMNRFQIAPEERVLSGLFGQAFADYTRRVRRWL